MTTYGGGLIVVLFFFGLSAGIIGKTKGSSFWLWFAVGFFTAFIGPIAALVSRNERNELRRQCPGCGKVVKLHDALCTRCGTELDFPDVAIESVSSAARQQA